jgi:uncharacterized protein (DUF1800 family)
VPHHHGLPVYHGPFHARHAERLLWRAGFGPRPGEARRLARHGLRAAVKSLTHPKSHGLRGRPPRVHGAPLAPRDAWGHDHLWWLDRMVRSEAPLVERMTLVWHDWFATSVATVDTKWMLHQNQTMRRHALGSFPALLTAITRDPAMLVWLNGTENSRWEPNENYARELQELFSLGADSGYTEHDVRDMARAMTGWRNGWKDSVGYYAFRFDPGYHDTGVKRIYGHRGRYDWRSALRLVIHHPAHAGFLVDKLWSYFVPHPPPRATRRGLIRLYERSGRQIGPLVEAILLHPALHAGPAMVKPPVVYVAGLLRALHRPVDTEDWTWICEQAGQKLFEPPNVAGWDDTRWLDTATWRARWVAANTALEKTTVNPDPPKHHKPLRESPERAVQRATGHWGHPALSRATTRRLHAFAHHCAQLEDEDWKRDVYPALRQNALRMLVATSPDLHTS